MTPITRSFRIGVTTITVITVVAGIGVVDAVVGAAECHRLGISTAACIGGPCTPEMAPAGCIPATCEQSQGCPGYITPAAAPATTDSGVTFEQVKPTLQINIPTFKLSDVRARTVDGTPTDVSIPWIGEYIAALYRWAVPVGAIIATVVIMVAGVIWLTSGGAGTLSTAKEWITNAVIGLLLLVGSYVVLNIINPDLVRLQALQIKLVAPSPLVATTKAEDEEEIPTGTSFTPTYVSVKSEYTANTMRVEQHLARNGPERRAGAVQRDGEPPRWPLQTRGRGVAPTRWCRLVSSREVGSTVRGEAAVRHPSSLQPLPTEHARCE